MPIGYLLFAALVLPTVGALVARALERRHPRAVPIIGGLTVVVAILSIWTLQSIPPDQVAWGRYGIFVPTNAPLLDDEAFALRRTPPLVAEVPTTLALLPTVAPPTATARPGGPQTYTVQSGDTLSRIAAAFGVSVQELLDANNLTKAQGDTLWPDQKLNIPNLAAAAVAPSTPPATQPPPAEIPTATPRPTRLPPTARPTAKQPRSYTVKAGDTLREIAERFDVSVQTLLDWNGLTKAEGDDLRPDQKLWLPPR